MLFAEISDYYPVIWIFIIVAGTAQWCKWLKASPTARGLAKQGALSLLSRLFKK
jgi:hypothetical protein